jgi:hypothetical protein
MNRRHWLKYIVIFIFSLSILWPTVILAVEQPLKIPELQIKLPGLLFSAQNKIETSTDTAGQTVYHIPWLAEYLNWLYNYAIGIMGLLALLAIMIGGFYWLLAGGSASRVKEAKSWISAAISGLILALASFFILTTINSQLVHLPTLKIAVVKGEDLVVILNKNVDNLNTQLGPGDYCGCFAIEHLTYASSGFTTAKIKNLLTDLNKKSPYLDYTDQINELCRSFNIDPVYVIAQWMVESSLGTAGVAKKHNNPGNFRCTDDQNEKTNWSQFGSYRVSFTCQNGWRHYQNTQEGLIGYFISKEINHYFEGYVRKNIYRYAPPTDGNNTNGYISTIVKMINKYSDNIQGNDKASVGACPCSNN